MDRLVTINGHLVFPPSEVSVFRDITLYCKVFKQYKVLLHIEHNYQDICYKYLKERGCFDFVEDIVDDIIPGSRVISDITPYNIRARKFWAGNLNRIISSF